MAVNYGGNCSNYNGRLMSRSRSDKIRGNEVINSLVMAVTDNNDSGIVIGIRFTSSNSSDKSSGHRVLIELYCQ